MKRLVIVLGVACILLGMSSCKKKSEEEKVGELLEKLSEAETETEAQELIEEIGELTEQEGGMEEKSVVELEPKIGEPLRCLGKDGNSRFSLTFYQVFISERVPWNEILRGREGKKYLIAYVSTKNLSPRKAEPPYPRLEVKADNGSIYESYASLFGRIGGSVSNIFDIEEWQPISSRPLEAGEKAWWAVFSEMPEGATPVELLGELDGKDQKIKICLQLSELEKNVVVSPSEDKLEEPKSYWDMVEEQKEKFLPAEQPK